MSKKKVILNDFAELADKPSIIEQMIPYIKQMDILILKRQHLIMKQSIDRKNKRKGTPK